MNYNKPSIPKGYAEDEPVEKKRKMLNEILF